MLNSCFSTQNVHYLFLTVNFAYFCYFSLESSFNTVSHAAWQFRWSPRPAVETGTPAARQAKVCHWGQKALGCAGNAITDNPPWPGQPGSAICRRKNKEQILALALSRPADCKMKKDWSWFFTPKFWIDLQQIVI